MTELEIMQRAKMYLDCLANGVDPLSGQPVGEGDIVRSVRISKCLTYVSRVLQRVIDNGGEVQKQTARVKRSDREPFGLSYEQMQALKPSDTPLSSAKITAMINAQIGEDMQKLKATSLNKWLVSAGLLTEVKTGKYSRKTPTEAGEQLGITELELKDESGAVRVFPVYSPEAQQLIFDNLDQIADFARLDVEEEEQLRQQKKQNDGKPWSQEEDQQLVQLYSGGATLKALSDRFVRTRKEIKRELRRLGQTVD